MTNEENGVVRNDQTGDLKKKRFGHGICYVILIASTCLVALSYELFVGLGYVLLYITNFDPLFYMGCAIPLLIAAVGTFFYVKYLCKKNKTNKIGWLNLWSFLIFIIFIVAMSVSFAVYYTQYGDVDFYQDVFVQVFQLRRMIISFYVSAALSGYIAFVYYKEPIQKTLMSANKAIRIAIRIGMIVIMVIACSAIIWASEVFPNLLAM